MMRIDVNPTDKQIFFDKGDIIVSKTDLKGRITYANATFQKIAGFCEADLIGQPHSIIRHPDMPRCVFKLLWDRLTTGNEVFAYVKNLTRTGDYYWVLAHVTPSYDGARRPIGYHSNRRVPDPEIVRTVFEPLYADLVRQENAESSRKTGMNKAFDTLSGILSSKGISYDEFIFSL